MIGRKKINGGRGAIKGLPLSALIFLFGCIFTFSMLRMTNHSNGASLRVPASNKPADNAGISTAVPTYSTPSCTLHPTSCMGICEIVGKFVKIQRDGVLSNPKSWLWYYQGVLDYYRCVGAKKVVEVGAAFGSQTAFHLKNADFIEEYHVVDPFMAGYDPEDRMSKLFNEAAPDASPDDISLGWFTSMAKHLGNEGDYLSEGMPPAGCKLRMHRLKSHEGAELFGDFSVDVVFIDGLHTYQGVVVDIQAWLSKIKIGGSLIFNDYNDKNLFPGIAKAVQEEADRQNIKILMLDGTNALLGGKQNCAKKGFAAI